MSEQNRFSRAPHYKSTPQDSKRVDKLRQIEDKEEELKLKREQDGFYC
jgi:hypothetical protein